MCFPASVKMLLGPFRVGRLLPPSNVRGNHRLGISHSLNFGVSARDGEIWLHQNDYGWTYQRFYPFRFAGSQSSCPEACRTCDQAWKFGHWDTLLEWVASFAAIYLLVLDRTHWKTNILTSLLIPYIFLSLPSLLFDILRGQIGRWIAFIAVVLKLFLPRHFPDWLEMPEALILLIVVAPGLLADTVKGSWIGVVICLLIACYLLQEHIRAAGGFRDAFTKAHGISNTVGIIILFVYPAWAIVMYIL